MKEFIQILRRFVPPYKKYLALSTLFNILSAVLNIFSFSLIVPILSILFQMEKALDCFWKAWKENHSEKAMKVYLLAYRSVHSEEEYRKRQEDLKTDEMVRQETDQALKSFAGLPEQHIASGETDRILEDLTREYHRSTGS